MEEWRNSLRDIAGGIFELSTSGEREFLAIGDRLQSFWQTSSTISERGGQAAEQLSGEKITFSVDQLKAKAEWLQAYLKDSETRLARHIETILKLLMSIEEAVKPLNSLNKIVMGLRILGISTRIESSLISGSDQSFVFLADEVNRQSENIDLKSSNIGAKLEVLTNGVKKTLADLRNLDSRQRGQGKAVIDKLHTSLATLTQKRDNSSAVARLISEQSTRIFNSMGDIVMSLQFHDITRQQIEHVKTTIETIIEEERHGNRPKVCALQAAQLQHTKNELVTAVNTLKENLLDIAHSVRGMLRGMTELTGMQRGEYNPFFDVLLTDMNAAIASLDEYKKAEALLSQSIDSFAETLETMAAFSKDIEQIGRSIKFVALNATIKAARIGRKGAAMDVVAQGIRELSDDARLQTDQVSSTLNEIMSVALNLREQAVSQSSQGETELDNMAKDLSQVMETVRNKNEESMGLLNNMDDIGGRLAEDMEKVAREINVHTDAESRLNKAISLLNNLAGQLPAGSDDSFLSDERAGLPDLTGMYTMASEREIYQSITGGGENDMASAENGLTEAAVETQEIRELEANSTDGEPDAAQEDDDDLGDNIELF